MKKYELLIQNCTINLNQNVAFDTIDELKEQLKGMEFVVNGGLIVGKKLLMIRELSSFEKIESIIDYVEENPSVTTETLKVIEQLSVDFACDYRTACEYFDNNFYMDCHNMEIFGREHAQNSGFEIPLHVEPYFNYEHYGISEALKFKRIDNYLFHYSSVES